MTHPTALPDDANAVLNRAHQHLQGYRQALGVGPDCDEALDAAWQMHRDMAALLPLAEQLLGECARLTDRLHVARRDPLTGLDTRAGWTDRAEQMAATGPIAVVFCDLDRFKPVNDRYGHAAGDAVLVATAQRISGWAGPAGAPARLGGDEFVVAIPDTGDLNERIGKLRSAVHQPIDFRGRELRVGASYGTACVSDQAVPTVSAALEAADAAMFKAKGRGRRGRRIPNPLMLRHQVTHLLQAG